MALCVEKKDIPLKVNLERCVKLVKFAPPHMEIGLTGDIYGHFGQELTHKLTGWTSQRWIISVVNADQSLTLAEQKEKEKQETWEKVKQEPLMQDILNHVPKATLHSMKDIKTSDADSQPQTINE